MMESILRDIRFGARGLLRSPGFTAIAVLTLGLGIGANATVFSILHALLLRPLPIERASQVFFLQTASGDINASIPDYRDLKAQNRTFDDLAAYRITPMALQREAGAERVWGYLATGNYFELLGVHPALGRFFTTAEDAAPGAAPLAVLSYEGWQRLFAADRGIIGRTARINNLLYTIIGVAPRGFHGTEIFYRPDIWVPMSMAPQIEARNWLETRNTRNVFVVGRLRADVTDAQGAADLTSVASRLAESYPDSFRGVRYQLVPPGLVGSIGRGPMSAFLLGVTTLAGLVLLAACANLGSLLSSRIVDRFRDIAIRLAMGATPTAVIRYAFIEVGILAAAGGAVGYVVAAGLLFALTRWQLPVSVPIQFDVAPDLRVVMFAAAVTLGTALLAAIAPVRHTWRTDPARLVGAAPHPGAFGWRVRDVLLAVQVAICCVVISASVVSVRSFIAALKVPIGFNANGVTTVGLDLAAAGYTPQDGLAFQQRALDAVAALPGVTAAAFTSWLPLTLDRSSATVIPSDLDPGQTRPVEGVLVYEVTPDILTVLEIPLVAGRTFTPNDRSQSEQVAIVNRTFARRVLRTDDAINMRFRTQAGRMIRIVGLVDDGKYGTLAEAPQPMMFRPVAQTFNQSMVLLVRSSRHDASLTRELERIVTGLDPRVPLLSRGSLADAIALAFLPAEAAGVGVTSFGLLAVLLSVIGVYGLAASSVSARARDIGIRVAIGAQPSQALRFVLSRTAMVLGAGSVIGLLGSIAMAPLLTVVMFHASARDPIVVALVAGVMTAIGLGAAWIPAQRVLALDPARALREA
jgi:predicted permease